MKIALKEAMLAAEELETPVGAVIVKDNKILACGRNRRETQKNALLHAELLAINDACKALDSWRLLDCDLYVTLEPCPMCAGAIINARIKRVIFGAFDKKNGSFGSVTDLSKLPYNHKPEIISGMLENECAEVLSAFFKKLRKFKKERN